MSKKKSKTRAKTSSRIRANARTIAFVAVLIAIFSGISFYMGMATPRSFVKPIDLHGLMTLSLDDYTTVAYGPAHTGVKVTFQVTDASQSWDVTIADINGFPIGGLTGSGTGVYQSPWHYSPGGCVI